MSSANQSSTNATGEEQYQGVGERLLFSFVTTTPCCVFLYINGTMLFTLRSKTVFCETSRYILLSNLLFADTVQMAVSQLLYILAACRIMLTYPVCGILNCIANLANEASPLTLVMMSLERFVAVRYPLRHASIVTIRNTGVAITVIWVVCGLNVLLRVLLLLDFPFEALEGLQMKTFCSHMAMLLGSMSAAHDNAYTCFLFVSASLAIMSSYIGVMAAARSASTDMASARKARNTLLLHMVQLGLSLSSTTYTLVLMALYRIVTRIVLVRVQNVLYIFLFIFPRCLSSLIYGIRDQTIRPMFFSYLCCQLKCSVVSVKTGK